MIEVHYFASIREALGKELEQLELGDDITTVELLIDHLVSIHGTAWEKTLKDSSVLVAINQTVAKLSASITDGDEVAFFPPVTGG